MKQNLKKLEEKFKAFLRLSDVSLMTQQVGGKKNHKKTYGKEKGKIRITFLRLWDVSIMTQQIVKKKKKNKKTYEKEKEITRMTFLRLSAVSIRTQQIVRHVMLINESCHVFE